MVKEMLKLDLHIHSQYSEDARGTPKEIIKSLKKKGINGMCKYAPKILLLYQVQKFQRWKAIY